MEQQPVPLSQLGGFSLPKQGAPLTPKDPLPEITREGTDEVERKPDDKVVQEARDAVDNPEATYEERIKSVGLTLDDAMKLVDEMAFMGHYSEEAKVSKRVKVQFITRSTRFTRHLTEMIDLMNPQRAALFNQIYSELQLSASLLSYAGHELPRLDETAPDAEWRKTMEAKQEFVRKLPANVFVTLCNLLVKFDAKVSVAFSQGYAENF